MNFEKITSITFSLMKLEDDSFSTGKAEYIKKASASFNIPKNVLGKNPENDMGIICASMYVDILSKIDRKEVDSLGIWVTYNEEIFENAIKLDTLNDIVKYSVEEINPTFEFLKMTINNYIN